MHNPLRSEADAFRLVLIVGLGAGIVILVTVLTRPAVGAALAAGLVGLGIGLVWRGARGTLPRRTEVATAADGTHRVLVVANETVGGRALLDQIRARCRGRDSEVMVVTPALTKSQLQHWTSDVDQALVEADRRREESARAIRAEGLDVRAEVGDPDPNVAIEDALRAFAADEVVISTHPPDRSRWLERGVVDRARAEVDRPITHVIVDLEAERV